MKLVETKQGHFIKDFINFKQQQSYSSKFSLYFLILLCIPFCALSQKPELKVVALYNNHPVDSLLPMWEIDSEVSFKFKWEAKHSTYVLIDGLDTLKHQLVDSIEISRGGNFTFIAVGPNGFTRQAIGMRTEWHNRPPGNSVHLFFYNGLDLVKYFKGGYKFDIETEKSMKDVEKIINDILQSKKYIVDKEKEVSTIVSTESVFSTSDYNANDKLCIEEECNIPKNKRVIERVVGFSIWVHYVPTSLTQSKNKFSFSILPDVLRRWRREGGEWSKDPENNKVAYSVCYDLWNEILALINKK